MRPLKHGWTQLRVGLALPSNGVPSKRLTELVRTEERYTSIRDALKLVKGIDLDKIISSVRPLIPHFLHAHILQLVASEDRETATAKLASARVGQILSLRNAIRSLKGLRNATQGCTSRLMEVIAQVATT